MSDGLVSLQNLHLEKFIGVVLIVNLLENLIVSDLGLLPLVDLE